MSDFKPPRWFVPSEVPPSIIDVVLDEEGRVRPAGQRPAGLERQRVLELRALTEAVVAGEAPLDLLSQRLQGLMQALRQAAGQCQGIIEKNPQHTEYFTLNIEAYERAIDGLVMMQAAVDADDGPALQQGTAAFEAAVVDLDALVASDYGR